MPPVNNFPGEPPRSTPTVAQPANRAPSQTQITGGSVTTSLPDSGTLTNILINATANGDNVLLAGTSSKTIKVYQLALGPASAAVNGVFKSGATPISGTMVLSTTQALVLNFSPYPWLLTLGTGSLVLNLSTTASVGGTVSLVQS